MKGRGNPWHDKRGRFCSGPSGRATGYTETENKTPDNGFVSAKTKKEAESFTRSMGIKPHFTGMSLENCNAINESVSEVMKSNPSALKFVKNVGSTENICDQYATEMHTAYRKSLDGSMGEGLTKQEKDQLADAVTAENRKQLRRNDNTIATISSDGSKGSKEITKVLKKYSGLYISKRAENMNGNDIKTQIMRILMQERVHG